MNEEIIEYGLWGTLIGITIYGIIKYDVPRFFPNSKLGKKLSQKNKQKNKEEEIKISEPITPKEPKKFYLWFDLTINKDHDELLENHYEYRKQFMEISQNYPEIEVHNGEYYLLPKDLVLGQTDIPGSRYCLAKTEEKNLEQLTQFRSDLEKKGLENRVIGPTSDSEKIKKYGDSFKIHETLKKFYGF